MNSTYSSLLMLVFFIGILYFMMIRPQKKKEKADREMRESLRVGDEVITIGGVIGKVEKITDKTIVISTGGAARNKVEFLKSAIASVNSAGDASKSEDKKDVKPEPEEERKPEREKKVTPKKLTKKSDSQNSSEAAE